MTKSMDLATDLPKRIALHRPGRLPLNLVANVGYLGLSTLVGVFYVPFLVRRLGPAAYGLIPLTGTITSYLSLITLGLNSAVGRSLTIALEQNNPHRANLIFNTSFWGSVALSLLLLVPAGLGLIYLDTLIRIPPGYGAAARWLFAGVLAAFLLNEVKTPFDVSSYCRNRFDLRNAVGVCEILVRVGLVFLLFYVVTPAIQYVGLAILGGTIVSTLGAILLWSLLTPTLQVDRRAFDWGVCKNLAGTGGWVIINQLGAFLYLGIDLLVANRLFGVEQSGRFAAILQLPLLIRSLGSAIGGVFSPTVLYFFARKDFDGLLRYLRRGIKCLGLLLALPIALMCGFSEPLLRLWLGPSFSQLSPLLVLMTAHLCINMAINPLLGFQLAANRVKVPGIVTVVMGMINLGLALLLAGPMKWGLYGIAAAGAIMLTTKNVLFTPIYAARVLGKPWGSFLREMVPITAITFGAILLARVMAQWWQITDWTSLIEASLAFSLLYSLVVYALALSGEERDTLKNALRITRSNPR